MLSINSLLYSVSTHPTDISIIKVSLSLNEIVSINPVTLQFESFPLILISLKSFSRLYIFNPPSRSACASAKASATRGRRTGSLVKFPAASASANCAFA